VPKSTGQQFSQHVTTGIAPRDCLDKMLAEPFESFTFLPAGAAVYQLGHFGTAATKLRDWDLNRWSGVSAEAETTPARPVTDHGCLSGDTDSGLESGADGPARDAAGQCGLH